MAHRKHYLSFILLCICAAALLIVLAASVSGITFAGKSLLFLCLPLGAGILFTAVWAVCIYRTLDLRYTHLDSHMNIYMRDRIFGRLLMRDHPSSQWIQPELARYGITFPKEKVVVGVMTLADYPEPFLSAYTDDGVDNNIYTTIRTYTEQTFQNSAILAQLTARYEEFVIIMNYTPTELGGDLYAVKNILKMHMDTLLHRLEVQEGIYLRLCMGKEDAGTEGIARSFATAVAAKEYRDMLGIEQREVEYHTDFEDIARFNTDIPVTGYRSLSLQRQLTASIEARRYAEAKAVLQELIKTEFDPLPPIGLSKIKLYGILYVIYTAMSSTAVRSADNIYEVLPIRDELFTSICISEVEAYINDVFDKLTQTCGPDDSAKDQPEWVSQAIAYLEKNYRDSSLNVNILADHLGMNPQYLSKVFRKYVQCSIMDYLQTLRVETAKEMLAQGHTVQDVAMHAGFSNTRTFSRIFVKYVGVTPGKYDKKPDHAPD